MQAHDGERIKASLSRGVFEGVLFTAELPIEQNGVLLTPCTNDENIVVSDHGFGAATCVEPKVDLFVCASCSRTRTIKVIHTILIL